MVTKCPPGTFSGSAAVRRSQAKPLVLDGVVVLFRIVLGDCQGKTRDGKYACRGQDRVAGDDDIAFCTCKINLRVYDIGLLVEDVKSGALSDSPFFDDTVKGELH